MKWSESFSQGLNPRAPRPVLVCPVHGEVETGIEVTIIINAANHTRTFGSWCSQCFLDFFNKNISRLSIKDATPIPPPEGKKIDPKDVVSKAK